MATKTGKKYIICDVAPAKHGKTTFLKEVIKVLTIHLGAGLVIATHWRIDQCVVFTHKKSGITILVQTGGDKEVSFVHTIEYLKTHEVDIILCARHTQGITKQIVQDIANKYNYEELIEQIKNMGIKPSDTVIIHSSMKSIGDVEGGADTVID